MLTCPCVCVCVFVNWSVSVYVWDSGVVRLRDGPFSTVSTPIAVTAGCAAAHLIALADISHDDTHAVLQLAEIDGLVT